MNLLPLILLLIGAYLAFGAIFAGVFVTVIVGRIDPAARHAPWSFRVLILPGAIALWPLLLFRWTKRRSPPASFEPTLERIEKTRGVLTGPGAYWALLLLVWFVAVAFSRGGDIQ